MPDTTPARPKRRYTMPADEAATRAMHAANARWAKTADRTAATKPARDGWRARFYRIPDEMGVTDPELRDKMARNAEAAEMARLRWIQIRRARGDAPPKRRPRPEPDREEQPPAAARDGAA